MQQSPEKEPIDPKKSSNGEDQPDYTKLAVSLAIEAIRYGSNRADKSIYDNLLKAIFKDPRQFFDIDSDEVVEIKKLKQDANQRLSEFLDQFPDHWHAAANNDLSSKLAHELKDEYEIVCGQLKNFASARELPKNYKGLSADIKERSETLNIPKDYWVGATELSCHSFFEAMAFGLNQLLDGYPHVRRKDGKDWDALALRQLCYDYYSTNTIFIDKLNKNERPAVSDYQRILPHHAEKTKESIIGGIPDVEGAIICHLLKINLHNIVVIRDEKSKWRGMIQPDFKALHWKMNTDFDLSKAHPNSALGYHPVVLEKLPLIVDVSTYQNNCGLFALALGIKFLLQKNPILKSTIKHSNFFEDIDGNTLMKANAKTEHVSTQLRQLLYDAFIQDENYKQARRASFVAFCETFLLKASDCKDQKDMLAFCQGNRSFLTNLKSRWTDTKPEFEKFLEKANDFIANLNDTIISEQDAHIFKQNLIQIMREVDPLKALNDFFLGKYPDQSRLLENLIFFRKLYLYTREKIASSDVSESDRRKFSTVIDRFFNQHLIRYSALQSNPTEGLLYGACLLTPSTLAEGKAKWESPLSDQGKINLFQKYTVLFVESFLESHWKIVYQNYCQRVQNGGAPTEEDSKWLCSIFEGTIPESHHHLSVDELQCLSDMCNVKLEIIFDVKRRHSNIDDNTVVLCNPSQDHWQVVFYEKKSALSTQETSKLPEIPTLHMIQEDDHYVPVLRGEQLHPSNPIILETMPRVQNKVNAFINDIRQEYLEKLHSFAQTSYGLENHILLHPTKKSKDSDPVYVLSEEFINDKRKIFTEKFNDDWEKKKNNWQLSLPEKFVDWYQVLQQQASVWKKLEEDLLERKGQLRIAWTETLDAIITKQAEKILAMDAQGLQKAGIPTTWQYRDRIDVTLLKRLMRRVSLDHVDKETSDSLALMAAKCGDHETYSHLLKFCWKVGNEANKKGLTAWSYYKKHTMSSKTKNPELLDPVAELLIEFEKELRRLHRSYVISRSNVEKLLNSTDLSSTILALSIKVRYRGYDLQGCYRETLKVVENCIARIMSCGHEGYGNFGADLLNLIEESKSPNIVSSDLTSLLTRYLLTIKKSAAYKVLQPPQPIVASGEQAKALVASHQIEIRKLRDQHFSKEQDLRGQLEAKDLALEAMSKANARLEQEKADLRKQLKETDEKLKEKTAETENLKNEVEILKTGEEKAKRETEAAKKEGEAAKKEGEAAKKEAEAAKKEIEEKNKEIERLRRYSVSPTLSSDNAGATAYNPAMFTKPRG